LTGILYSIFTSQLQGEQAFFVLFECLSHEPFVLPNELIAGTIVSNASLALASDCHTRFSSCQPAKPSFLKIIIEDVFSLLLTGGCSAAHTISGIFQVL